MSARYKHGHASRSLPKGRTPLYLAWRNMRTRCRYAGDKHFHDYGARGIDVCDEWESFANFERDMGPHPGKGFSLDRIDNDLGYFAGNCRWASSREQSRNKRNNVMLTHGGKTLCIADWAPLTGLSDGRIRQRISAGWSHDRALTEPAIPKRKQPR